jgi:hypothetical protein
MDRKIGAVLNKQIVQSLEMPELRKENQMAANVA